MTTKKRPVPHPVSIPSTLGDDSIPDNDLALRRLRQRAGKLGYSVGPYGVCDRCDARLTGVDVDLGACTQCGCAVPRLDEGDGLIEGGEE